MKNIFLPIVLLLIISNLNQISGQNKKTPCTTDCFPIHWVISAYTAPEFNKFSCKGFENEVSTKYNLSTGVNIAYYFKTNTEWKMAFSAGINYASYKNAQNLNIDNELWTYDKENISVYLSENGTIRENQNILRWTIPILSHFDYHFSQRIDFYVNVGFNYSIFSKKKFDSEATISRSGFYPAYNNLIFNYDVEGADYFYPTNKTMSANDDLNFKNFLSLQLEAGVKYKLTPRLSCFLGYSFQRSITNVSNYTADAFTYIDNNRKPNTLMSKSNKVTALANGISVGISINLGKCKQHVEIKDTIKPLAIDTTKKVIVQNLKTDTTKTVSVKSNVVDSLKNKTVSVKNNTADSLKNNEIKQSENQVVTTVKEIIFDSKNKDTLKTDQWTNKEHVTSLEEINSLLDKGAVIGKDQSFRERIDFEYNSSQLSPKSQKTIEQLIVFMSKQSNCYVTIYGNTDNKGSEEYNKILSLLRAQTIVDYMISKGVAKERLKAVGNGNENPIDDNNTEVGRRNNRRAEFEIISK